MKNRVELKIDKPKELLFKDMPNRSYGIIVETKDVIYVNQIILKLNHDLVVSLNGEFWWQDLNITTHKVRLIQPGEEITVTIAGVKA